MNALQKITADTVPAYSPTLGDAWAGNCIGVTEAIRFCRQYAKVIAERDQMLTPKVRLHSEAYVAQCEKNLPWALSLYLERVRAVSECEAKMDAMGMAYAISSDDWRA